MKLQNGLTPALSICIALFGLGITQTSNASDAQRPTVTIVAKDNSTTVTNAVILLRSSRGYSAGYNLQDFGGLYVSDAIVPPKGMQFQRALVKLEAMKEIAFIAWDFKSGDLSFIKAKITMSDGATREVFLWTPGNGEQFFRLAYPDHLKVVGKLRDGGSTHDIEKEGHKEWQKLVVEQRK